MSSPKWIAEDIIREAPYRMIERHVSLRNRAKYAMDTAAEIVDSARQSISRSEGDIRVRIMA